MTIQTNAINATFQKTQDLISRLSSGSRINRASDDLAGFAIGQRQTSTVNGLYQSARNLGDGISLTETADAALGASSDILQRIRELSVQANNGILNNSDRANIQKEIDQLTDEFDDIAENTQFNGQKLFDGSYSGTIQVGDDSNDGVKIQLGDLRNVIDDIDVTTESGASDAIQNLDNALETINSTRSDLGATKNRFENAMNELQNAAIAHTKSRSAVMDTDFAADISENEQNQVLSKVQTAMMRTENSGQTFLMELFNATT
jgi:flagellin